MKKGLMLASLIAGSLLSYGALAEKVGGISLLSPDIEMGDSSIQPMLIQGQIGADIYSNIMAELRVAFAVSDDDLNGVNVKLSSMQGAYLKMHLPVWQQLSAYGLAGFIHQSFSTDEGADMAPFDSDQSGVSAGFGFSFSMEKMPTVYLEYVSYYSDSEADMNFDVSGFSLGLNFPLE